MKTFVCLSCDCVFQTDEPLDQVRCPLCNVVGEEMFHEVDA